MRKYLINDYSIRILIKKYIVNNKLIHDMSREQSLYTKVRFQSREGNYVCSKIDFCKNIEIRNLQLANFKKHMVYSMIYYLHLNCLLY